MDFTLLIPTRDRPDYLNGLLKHFVRVRPPFQIVVLDSSDAERQTANAAVIRAAAGLDILHRTFPHDTPIYVKFAAGFEMATTAYAGHCADDDLIFLDGLERCLRAMDSDADIAVCDGIVLNFDPMADGTLRLTVEYDGPSIVDAHPLQRMSRRLDRYEATTYSIFRTDVARVVFGEGVSIGANFSWEIFTTLAPLSMGYHVRLPLTYSARRARELVGEPEWHPRIVLEKDPTGFILEFRRHLRRLSQFLKVHGGIEASRVQLAIIHAVYLRKELSVTVFKDFPDPTIILGRDPLMMQVLQPRSLSERVMGRLTKMLVRKSVPRYPEHIVDQIKALLANP